MRINIGVDMYRQTDEDTKLKGEMHESIDSRNACM